MENDIDGDPYTYVGPCGSGANCINHEIGWSCECIVPQALPPPLTEWQPIGTPQEQFYRPSQYEQGRGFFKTLD